MKEINLGTLLRDITVKQFIKLIENILENNLANVATKKEIAQLIESVDSVILECEKLKVNVAGVNQNINISTANLEFEEDSLSKINVFSRGI